MDAGIFMLIILFIGLLIFVINKRGKKRPKLSMENIPSQLGKLDNAPITPLINQLNSALDEQYIQQVKKRFLQEDSNRTEDEFEWLLFELKRYFILTKVLKSTPMFSGDVDEIWHEMILFTNDYEKFSQNYYGKMLHHYPNTDPVPAPQERAFFDWVFSQFFSITEFTWNAWGDFFSDPLNKDTLKDFKTLGRQELATKYFKDCPDCPEAIYYLIDKMKEQLASAEQTYSVKPKGKFAKQQTFGDMSTLSLVMVFYSYYHFDEYWSYAKEYAYGNAAYNTSGCTSAVFCGVGSDSHDHGGSNDNGSDGGGSDGGGSSCSSCGGGCSS
ncbi:hypothetical protein [Metabacillus malikii]|uniref:Uncharacterized protein n=1 Tax=Metabacillus malikii TaxID=1504265 RepID=A0ABT9ZAQ6_9BACI|nr:hypothetical protein [Metabacillus malikii]MDQ0229328.1 hypothetical protein [Metabacillus malikii]